MEYLVAIHSVITVLIMSSFQVLDQGALVEYDAPYTLLEKQGLLYDMVRQTGSHEEQRLTDIARQTLVARTVMQQTQNNTENHVYT